MMPVLVCHRCRIFFLKIISNFWKNPSIIFRLTSCCFFLLPPPAWCLPAGLPVCHRVCSAAEWIIAPRLIVTFSSFWWIIPQKLIKVIIIWRNKLHRHWSSPFCHFDQSFLVINIFMLSTSLTLPVQHQKYIQALAYQSQL